MSKILSVILRMASTTGSPSVRFGTKWLSITSTCIASELGTDSIAVCRFAKSADRMLGMILRATMPTLVFGEIARAAVLDERASSQTREQSASEGLTGCEQMRKAAALTARSAPSELGERGNQACVFRR